MLTIKDIARELGISTSSVSRALNNHPNIRFETRERVLETCKRLNYVPNIPARSLVNKSPHTIGLMIPDIADSFFSGAAYGVEDIMKERGMEVFYASTARNPEKVRRFLLSSLERRFSGMFITPDVWDEELLAILRNMSVPVISLRRRPPEDVNLPWVDADHRDGARQATEYLYSLGHRSIGFICLPTQAGREREVGYREVMDRHKLKPVLEYGNAFGNLTGELEAGRTAAEALLLRAPEITAIFAANDRLGIGVLTHLAERSVAVPDEISVMGFDNLDLSDLYWIRLTTMEQPRRETGREAARMMCDMIEQGVPPVSRALKTTLIRRGSTGPVRKMR